MFRLTNMFLRWFDAGAEDADTDAQYLREERMVDIDGGRELRGIPSMFD